MRRSAIFPLACVIPLIGVLPQEKPITFSETIAPIVFERCAGCHRAGGAVPFALVSYEDAVENARQIAAVTRTRKMPPWHAESGSYPFKYDHRSGDGRSDSSRTSFRMASRCRCASAPTSCCNITSTRTARRRPNGRRSACTSRIALPPAR